METPKTPASAARLAELLGDRLPDPASIPDASFALAARVRELVEAVVMTDVDGDDTRRRGGRHRRDHGAAPRSPA